MVAEQRLPIAQVVDARSLLNASDLDPRPLAQERDRDAAGLLAEAFFDYPAWDAIGPRAPARRCAMIRRYYEAELALARRWGGDVLATFDGNLFTGVVLSFEPGRYPPPSWSLLWFAPLLLAGPSAVARALRTLWLMDSSHPQGPHLFLHTVAADPSHQRRGFGRALIKHVTDRADEQRLPIYLTTARPELVGYYEALGFGLVGRLQLPRGVPLWQMLRESG